MDNQFPSQASRFYLTHNADSAPPPMRTQKGISVTAGEKPPTHSHRRGPRNSHSGRALCQPRHSAHRPGALRLAVQNPFKITDRPDNIPALQSLFPQFHQQFESIPRHYPMPPLMEPTHHSEGQFFLTTCQSCRNKHSSHLFHREFFH